MKKQIAIFVTMSGVFFGAIAALGADQYLLPVLRYQHAELLNEHLELVERVREVERRDKMEQIYTKRVELEKLRQEIENSDNPPRGLLDFEKYLEEEIARLLNEINI